MRGDPRNKSRSGYIIAHTPIFGIAAVALLLRNDINNNCHRERSVAIPAIKVGATCIGGHTFGRVDYCGVYVTNNIESVGSAFPGDVSLTLDMTNCLCAVILSLWRRISRKGG